MTENYTDESISRRKFKIRCIVGLILCAVFIISIFVSSAIWGYGTSFGVIMIGGFLLSLYLSIAFYDYSTDTSDERDLTIETGENQYWKNYGEHIYLAYVAKFGGENNGFKEEIKKRVYIMDNNGRGFTRAIAKDWLYRMHKFTEAK